MTFGGLMIMLISVSSVTTLFVWCIYKVLTTGDADKTMHGFEKETPDVKERKRR